MGFIYTIFKKTITFIYSGLKSNIMAKEILLVIGIGLLIIGAGLLLFGHHEYEYKNFTSVITDKYVDTRVWYDSNNNPQYEDSLFIVTENGTFQVDPELYKNSEKGDNINLTKNLNNSFIEVTKYHNWG